MTNLTPLPVKGYPTQPQEYVDLVNEGKELAERVERYLDRLVSISANNDIIGKSSFGMRELAIGKTNIQTGFMWTFRAIFMPQRVALPEDGKDAS